MKVTIVIDLEELTRSTKGQLLDTLYHVEDQMMYKCKSVSRTIDLLQELLHPKEEGK